jgi:hypothetical protein
MLHLETSAHTRLPEPSGRAGAKLQRWRDVPASRNAAERLRERRVAADAVIAYGCGWGRRASDGAGDRDWDGVWPRARRRLEHDVSGWTRATFKAAATLKGFGADFVPHALVQRVTDTLISGGCVCLRRAPADASATALRNLKSGHKKCVEQHRLSGWRAADLSLRDFVARAIKGSAQRRGKTHGVKQLKANAIWSAMLRDTLEERGVRLGKVLVWSCHCHQRKSQQGECPRCGTRFDYRHTRLDVEVRLIIPEDQHGDFVPETYWRCQNAGCKTYYPPFEER